MAKSIGKVGKGITGKNTLPVFEPLNKTSKKPISQGDNSSKGVQNRVSLQGGMKQMKPATGRSPSKSKKGK